MAGFSADLMASKYSYFCQILGMLGLFLIVGLRVLSLMFGCPQHGPSSAHSDRSEFFVKDHFFITSSVACSLDSVPYSYFFLPFQRKPFLSYMVCGKNGFRSLSLVLLFLSGDIEVNPGPAQPLRMGHFNCQSIFPNADFDKPLLIDEFIRDNDLDVLAVTETWIPPSCPPSLLRSFTPDGFEFNHSSREDTLQGRGGGVGFFFKKSLVFQPFSLPDFESFECIANKLVLNNKSYICINIYRHISSLPSHFLNEFGNLLETVATLTSDVFIFGDFNFHYNKPDESSTLGLQTLLDSFNIKQYVDFPTHKTSHNTLDLFISNIDSNLVTSVKPSHLPFSVHEPYLCDINVPTDTRPPGKFKCFRNFKNFCHDKFSHDFRQTDIFNFDFSHLNLNEYTDIFYTTLVSVLDKHAPLQRIKVTDRNNKPFYNPEIRKQKRIRSRLESIWRRNKSQQNLDSYKAQSKLVSKMLRDAKKQYYRNIITSNSNNPKKVWKILSALLGRGRCTSLPQSFDHSSLASMFLHFFDDKIKKLSTTLLSQLNAGSTSSPHIDPPNTPPKLTNLSLSSEDEVAATINKSSNAFIDSDILPTKYLKLCLPVLIKPITKIVNLSLLSGDFPHKFKSAMVHPLIKKPNLPKEELNSYRPISNLHFISKIIERIVYNRLINHISCCSGFSAFQSAYRINHSCESALTRIVNDILSASEKRKVTALVLLDLSAAFDTVDHTILLHRLKEYFGISGSALKFFESYLQDRTQAVVIGESTSPCLPLITGVPQGSVLGPVLFSMYTAPLDKILGETDIGYHFYADDTQIYISFTPNTADDAIDTLSSKLTELHKWFTNNKLMVNPSKTEFMIIGTKQQCQKVEAISLTFQGTSVAPAEQARNLGVIFDPHMLFDKQIVKVCQNAFFHIRQFRLIRPFLDKGSAIALANALVSSRLDFCNTLYFGLPQARIHLLQKVQNSLARVVVPGTAFRDHISPVLRGLHWLPVQKRIHFKIASTTFKVLNSKQPEYLACLLSKLPDSARRSSNKNLLVVPFVKSEIGRRAFSFAAPSLWNSLPQLIRDSTSTEVFKSRLKTFLFNA